MNDRLLSNTMNIKPILLPDTSAYTSPAQSEKIIANCNACSKSHIMFKPPTRSGQEIKHNLFSLRTCIECALLQYARRPGRTLLARSLCRLLPVQQKFPLLRNKLCITDDTQAIHMELTITLCVIYL